MLVYGKCECFVMQMLYVCVLCASYGMHVFPVGIIGGLFLLCLCRCVLMLL